MVIKNERKRYASDLTNSQWNDFVQMPAIASRLKKM